MRHPLTELFHLSNLLHLYGLESWTIKDGWTPKNWCFWTVVLEKTFESLLDCKEMKPVHPKGNQSWIFIGRTDAETPTLWPPDVKNWFIWENPDAGKDWWQEEKGTTEDEIVGWHHVLDGHEFEQALGVGDGQGSLVCCSHKESDKTEQLNWAEVNLLQMPNDGRMVDAEFFGNFLCGSNDMRGLALMMALGWWLSASDGWPLHSSSSGL